MERMDDKYRKEKYNTRHAGFLAVFLAAALLPGLFPATAQRVEAAGIHSIEVVVRSLNVEGMMLPEDDLGGTFLCQTQAAAGDLVTFTAKPNPGYRVSNAYYYNKDLTGSDSKLDNFGGFVMPDRDIVIMLTFQKRNPEKSSSITVEYGEALDAPGGNVVTACEPGEEVFPAVKDELVPEGKYFQRWTSTDVLFDENRIFFKMTSKPVSIQAELKDSAMMTVSTVNGNIVPDDLSGLSEAVKKAAKQGQIDILYTSKGSMIDLDKDGSADVSMTDYREVSTCSIKNLQYGFNAKNSPYTPVIFNFNHTVGWPFADVPEEPGSWVYDSVSYVYNAGLMKGMSEGWFGASELLQREQMAIILWNWSSKPVVSYSSKFSDVPSGAENEWYSIPILWASETGIVNGYTNGKFGVGDPITREQFCKMMYSYAKFLGYDVSDQASLEGFPDGNSVSDWALTEMKWAVAKGLVHGEGDGRLNPQGTVSRAVCATIIRNFIISTSSG